MLPDPRHLEIAESCIVDSEIENSSKAMGGILFGAIAGGRPRSSVHTGRIYNEPLYLESLYSYPKAL
jgi:hypothetical protein